MNSLIAFNTASDGRLGVEGTLMLASAPVSSSSATRSVNVPPMSMLTLYRVVSIHPYKKAEEIIDGC
jgi:hypothetical protein